MTMIFVGTLKQIGAQERRGWIEKPGTGMHLGRGIWAVRLERRGTQEALPEKATGALKEE